MDYFRFIIAFLIITNHTGILSSYSPSLDFTITNIVARIGVPFFFMITGYFFIYKFLDREDSSIGLEQVNHYNKKIFSIYIISSLIYLPINIYAGHIKYKGLVSFTIGELKRLIFDGTFYHLWYLPALILGVYLLYFLSRKLNLKMIGLISLVLYLIGLLGDSYYGLAVKIPGLSILYKGMFKIFGYTRNGLFFPPIFLYLGALIRLRGKNSDKGKNFLGFLISIGFMIFEALYIKKIGLAKHDSMYVFLLPTMIYLFNFILSLNLGQNRDLRKISLYIYLFHPLFIVLVRAGSKLINLDILVKNSLIFYIAVALSTFIFSALLNTVFKKRREKLKWNGKRD